MNAQGVQNLGIFAELSPPYATIVADPPWLYDDAPAGFQRQSGKTRFVPYSMMTVDEIAALPVRDLSTYGSHLYLWTTNRYLEESYSVVRAWGFKPAQTLTWCKEPTGMGPGGAFAITTEFVIFARRMNAKREVERAGVLIQEAREAAGLSRAELHRLVRGGEPTGLVYRWEDDDSLPTADDWMALQRVLPSLAGVNRPFVAPAPDTVQNRINTTWFQWKRGPHSVKPPAFMDVVEHVSEGPFVELFARAPRLGWDSWGHGYEGGRPTP